MSSFPPTTSSDLRDHQMTTFNDHVDEATRAEQAEHWQTARDHWTQAIAACDDTVVRAIYSARLERCEVQLEVDRKLAKIAKQVLRIPTLDSRRSDHLDFHEVSVWNVKQALLQAYLAGRESQ